MEKRTVRKIKILVWLLLFSSQALQGAEPDDLENNRISAVAQDLSPEKLRDLVLEQRKAIDALLAAVTAQQAKIEKLQAQIDAATLPVRLDATAEATRLPAVVTAAVVTEPASAQVVPPATVPLAQTVLKKEPEGGTHKKSPAWYEKLSLRGYTQIRYNRLLETSDQLKCEQCDKSWGDNSSFLIRRARLVLSGDLTDRLYLYIQPDLASSASSGSLHFAQVRDAYFDLALDKKKEFRFRFGQSKVPFGFENLQSSQNRLALDRTDSINSGVPNERDLGAFFYWAPAKLRKRFSELVSSGLKGSGDYGIFGAGIYNGQASNRPEANDSVHVVSRFSYPFQLKSGQFIEPGISAYTGKYSVTRDQRNTMTLGRNEFRDQRVAASLTVYPQPFGFQAEYNVGTGPEFNPANLTIEGKRLHGGYAQVMYMRKLHNQAFTPFFRTQHYRGGKKHETDARRYIVHEHEIGLEWQPIPLFEFTAMYTISDRTFEDALSPSNRQKGNLLRMQLQFNY